VKKDIATQRFTNINQNDTHQQVLPQTDWKDVTSQTGHAEIPIKNKYVDTTEDGPIHGELTTVNPIERTEVTAKSEKEDDKEHIYNLPVGQKDKKSLNQVGLAHLDLGIAYAERSLIDQAIREFQSATEANPHHIESHIRLGTAYGLKGMREEALSEFKKAIDIDLNEAVAKIVFNALPAGADLKEKTDVVKAHINLGNAYKEEEELEMAQLQYEKALELKPEHPVAKELLSEIYYSLGTSHLENKKYDNAINAFDKVLEINPAFPQIKDVLKKAHYNLGINYAKDGDLNKAIIEFNKTMDINHNYAVLDKNNVNIISKDKSDNTDDNVRKENSHEEEEEEKSLQEQIPHEIEVPEEMALVKEGDAKETDNNIPASTHVTTREIKNEEAEKTIAKHKTISGHMIFSYYITRNYKNKIGVNEAIKKYEDDTIKNPYDNNAFLNLAHAYYIKAMHLDDAIARREDAPEDNQSFSVKRFYLNDDAGNEEVNEAGSTEQTETFEKGNVTFHNRLGKMYQEKEMFSEAIIEYKNALRIDPNSSKALYSLAFSFSEKSSYLGIALKSRNYNINTPSF
jgi:tetratricopeptide (TPR) repeat protein